jgi:hypothetical protein
MILERRGVMPVVWQMRGWYKCRIRIYVELSEMTSEIEAWTVSGGCGRRERD